MIYIAKRSLAVFLLLLLGACIHEFFIYPEVKKNEGWLQELVESRLSTNPDVIYFSASTNQALSPDDTDRRFISHMISENTGIRLASIDTGAIHAGIFYEILNRIPKERLPETIIVDMNIRSFGANWIHSYLENSLQRNLVYWNDRPGTVNHLLAAVRWYDYKSPAEHSRAIDKEEKFGNLPFGGSHQTILKWCDSLSTSSNPTQDGRDMIRHFGFLIDENNEQLKRFDKIAEWCEKYQIPVIFVILPENVERMEELVGPDLKELVRLNAAFLEARYKMGGATVLNLWNSGGKDIFFENFPTEHYRSAGRAIVAGSISNAIKQLEIHDDQRRPKHSR